VERAANWKERLLNAAAEYAGLTTREQCVERCACACIPPSLRS